MVQTRFSVAGAAAAKLAAAVVLGLGVAHVSATSAFAQDKKKEAPKKQQSAWVKLCEKAPLVKKGDDGKQVKEEKEICLTHHERLDGSSGRVLVSAAIRKVAGQDTQHLMVMVPLGMALPPGLKAAVYTKEQWEKAAKNEKVDDKDLKPMDLKYALCHNSGCTAEVPATTELIDSMQAGGGIMILAMNASAQPIGFPVPLDGFKAAYTGKPVDNAEYKKARGQLMAQIRKRQEEAYKKWLEEKKKDLPPKPGEAPKK